MSFSQIDLIWKTFFASLDVSAPYNFYLVKATLPFHYLTIVVSTREFRANDKHMCWDSHVWFSVSTKCIIFSCFPKWTLTNNFLAWTFSLLILSLMLLVICCSCLFDVFLGLLGFGFGFINQNLCTICPKVKNTYKIKVGFTILNCSCQFF